MRLTYVQFLVICRQVNSSPTQTQIAGKLGVSQALVSQALSGRAGEIGASPATVEKIRRTAAEWNYQPSATALALLGAPTRTIGVVVKNFDDPYFGHLIGALQSSARDNRHSLLLTGSGREDLSGLLDHLAGLGHREIGFVAREAGANRRCAVIHRRGLRARGFCHPGKIIHSHWVRYPEACFGFDAGGTTAVSSVDSNGPDSAGPSKCLGACPGVLYFIRGDRWTGCRPRHG